MEWQDLLVGGVPLAALVVGLVNLAKNLGMDVKYAPYLNGGLAALGYVVVTWVIPTYPAVVPYLQVATGTIATFLIASGIHQFGKITTQ